jgi:hypothetical protein
LWFFLRAEKKKLILAETGGIFGYVFVDLGDSHVMRDPSGEKSSWFLLAFIPIDETEAATIGKPEDRGEEHQSYEVEDVKRSHSRIK